MQTVSIDEVDPPAEETRIDRRKLAAPLGATDVALNYFALDPGQRLSESLHAHADQEEIFVVIAGELTFETRDGAIVVAADEAIRFAPGEFQSGNNDGDERVIALGVGAPRDTDDLRIARTPVHGDVSCPDCGLDEMRLVTTGGEPALVCPDCGAEREG